MEPALDRNIHRRFLWHRAGDLQNQSLRLLDALLSTPDGDRGLYLGGFVHIDLSTGVVLDIVDIGPSFAEDSSNGTSRNRECYRVVVLLLELESLGRYSSTSLLSRRRNTHIQEFRLGTSNTLLTTLNQDLIWRQ